jgi:uncharacterized protein YjiS (DUF1127 family)
MLMPDHGMVRFLATPDGFAELRSAGAEMLRCLAHGALRRLAEGARYRRAPRELRRLDGRDLGDLAIGRADLPRLARRHAAAQAPA